MGLDDKLESELGSLDYRARECLDSGRNRLHIYSKEYCLLSHPDSDVYCSLQSDSSDGRMKCCRHNEYIAEMNKKSFNKG